MATSIGWTVQFEPTDRFGIEANKIFNTYEDAIDFVQNSAISYVGSVITITNDVNDHKNGVYYVKSIGELGEIAKVSDKPVLKGELESGVLTLFV